MQKLELLKYRKELNELCCAVNKNGNFAGLIKGDSWMELVKTAKRLGVQKYGVVFVVRRD